MEQLLAMRNEEIDKLRVIREVLTGKLSWREAGERLSLSVRQIGYLCARVREEGNGGIIHRLRGQPSNHRLDPEQVEKALELVRARYADFGPTLACEKLWKAHAVQISVFTLRQKMMEAGIWKGKRGGQKYRALRQRRSAVGMLVQLDGSEHDWFEGRGPRCVLLVYIDDASSRILYAEFVSNEDTLTLLGTTRSYLERHGRPLAFYVDQDSIYKVNRQASVEEQLRDSEPLTQFGRAMQELGIEVIHAHSPQAKGRVERGFKTHQDRLVKELRLAGISAIAAANDFLWDRYLADHNERCAVEPARPHDAHRALLASHRLEEILSLRTARTVFADFTVRFQNQFLQLAPNQPVRVGPKDSVMVETRLDGSMHLRFKDRYLSFQAITGKPSPAVSPRRGQPAKALKRYRPPSTHPWKRASFEKRELKKWASCSPSKTAPAMALSSAGKLNSAGRE
jgi:hypothetical protein